MQDNYSDFFYIDASRLIVIRDTESTLRRLVKGQFKHRNGFCRLLLGHKGVGKTTLLDCIAKAAHSVYGKQNLIVCCTAFNCKPVAGFPSTAIAKSIGVSNKTIVQLNSYLEKVDKFVLFIADELDSVFSSEPSIGHAIIGEIAEIGDSRVGRMHCIISGSSSHLRQLCFCKLPADYEKKFPSYSKRFDLNSTKFSARWIHPFLEKDDFCKVVRLLRKDSPEPDEPAMVNIYLQTGGNARHMQNMVQLDTMNVDSYSLSLKSVSESAYDLSVLKGVLNCVTDFMPDCENSLERMAQWTRYVTLASVENLDQIRSLEGDFKRSIYNLSDRGLLRFKDDFDATTMVSLGTPRICLELNRSDKCDLSAREATALLFPHGKLSQTAEDVAMRFLIKQAKQWIQSDHIVLKHDGCELLAISKCNKPEVRNLHSMSMDDIVNCFWKEYPDSFGADAVFNEAKQGDTVISHRIQLKLGKSRIMNADAEGIVNKFHTHAPTIVKQYQLCGITVSEQKFYLVTTRQLAQAETTILQNGNIIIKDSAFLSQNIWPPIVKNLGAPFR
eukprot:Em0022g640a